MKLRQFFKSKEFKIFLTVWLVYVFYFSDIGGAYADSAAALTVSIVDYHTLSIDAYKNHSNAHNFAYYKGKFYSGVAPGTSFLAAPIYAIFKSLTRISYRFGYSPPIVNLVAAVALSAIFLSAVASALTAVLLFKLLEHFTKNKKKRLFLTFVFSFGTLFFIYSTQYEPVVIATFFSFSSFYLLFKVKHKEMGYNALFLAGFLCAAAISMHYLQIVIFAALSIYFLSFSMNLKKLFLYGSGALIPIVLLMSYHYYVFDSPFKTGYHYLYNVHLIKSLPSDYATKLVFPTSNSIFGLSFSPFRGIFFYMPITLLSLYGIYWNFRRNSKYISDIFFCCFIFISSFLFISALGDWWGGCSFGPRYLMPVLPFIFVIIGSAIDYLKVAFAYILGLLSVFINYLPIIYGRECRTYNDILNVYIPSIMKEGFSRYLPLTMLSKYLIKIPPYAIGLFHILGLFILGFFMYLLWKKN